MDKVEKMLIEFSEKFKREFPEDTHDLFIIARVKETVDSNHSDIHTAGYGCPGCQIDAILAGRRIGMFNHNGHNDEKIH